MWALLNWGDTLICSPKLQLKRRVIWLYFSSVPFLSSHLISSLSFSVSSPSIAQFSHSLSYILSHISITTYNSPSCLVILLRVSDGHALPLFSYLPHHRHHYHQLLPPQALEIRLDLFLYNLNFLVSYIWRVRVPTPLRMLPPPISLLLCFGTKPLLPPLLTTLFFILSIFPTLLLLISSVLLPHSLSLSYLHRSCFNAACRCASSYLCWSPILFCCWLDFSMNLLLGCCDSFHSHHDSETLIRSERGPLGTCTHQTCDC